jgi:hypothetical protein
MNLFFGNCQAKGFIPQLSVSTNYINAPATGGTYNVIITSNETWSISVSGQELFFTIFPMLGGPGIVTIQITIDENINPMSRSVDLTVSSASGLTKVITIYQNPA